MLTERYFTSFDITTWDTELVNVDQRIAMYAAVRDVFGSMDKDGSAALDWDEFTTAIGGEDGKKPSLGLVAFAVVAMKDELRLKFDAIDVDNSGSVTKVELAKALTKDRALTEKIKVAGLNAEWYVLEQMDTDGGGKLTWTEFKSVLQESQCVQLLEGV